MSIDFDVIVIGAGFGGLYAVHKMRDHVGLNVKAFEAADGPGGVWRWNSYPGARCDIESVHYSYSFSDEVQRGWEWTERFAAQSEILSYLEYVADKIDVRKEYSFNTRVTSMSWSNADNCWDVTTDDGKTYSARFVITATGNLSVPKPPEFPGAENFKGEIYSTSSWPKDKVDLAGKRVGVIGTGASGVQVIQTIAPEVGHLTVFQRTANYCTPLNNAPIDPEQRRWFAENHEQVRAGARDSLGGVPYGMPHPSSYAASEEERRARYAEMLQSGGLRMIGATYADILVDEGANRMISDYVREHIAGRVKDPETARKLIPTDHPYGTKRPPLETGYYEVFNRDNVELVDLKANPVRRFTEKGIETEQGEYELDIIILATGFDALTGALLKLGITGRNGLSLNEYWAEGARNFLGIAVHQFPNLFTLTGPTSAVVLYNNPLANEDHVDFAAAAIEYCLKSHAEVIEATAEAEQRWRQLADDLLHLTLFPKANSWYTGANVPGKPRSASVFVAPVPLYRAFTGAVYNNDFGGFQVGEKAAPLPAMLKLDAAMSLVVCGAIMGGIKPLEAYSVPEIREMIDAMAQGSEQACDVDVIEASYRGGSGQQMAVRIYVPDVDGPLPILLFYHGGGFVAGSLNAFDSRCRTLAEELGVLLISPSYSLAPEHPFPAAVNDSYAALLWAAREAQSYGGDASRLVVSGESAGANLAAVVAQRARDENGPAIAAQILVTPAIDAEADTRSRHEFADAPFLSTAAMDRFWSTYLVDMAHARSALASPNRAPALNGLPPALVLTAECDPLRDEGEDYGNQLQRAGVQTEIRRIEGLTHASFSMEAKVPRAREYTRSIAAFLDQLFDRREAVPMHGASIRQ